MNAFRWRAVVAIVLGFATSAVLAADVTGTWQLTVQSPQGTGTPTLVLEQKGESVTGTYKGRLGEVPLTGSVKDDAVLLTVKTSGPMGEMELTYDGKVEGDTMSGTVRFGSFGEGPFTGKKQ